MKRIPATNSEMSVGFSKQLVKMKSVFIDQSWILSCQTTAAYDVLKIFQYRNNPIKYSSTRMLLHDLIFYTVPKEYRPD